MDKNEYAKEVKKVHERPRNNTFYKKSSSSMARIKKWDEDIEIYQIIGFLGCAFMMLGSMMPLYSVLFYKKNETLYYKDAGGFVLIICVVAAFILMLKCYHKYSMIPVFIILAQNLSIRVGLIKIYGCYTLEAGYYFVWIGIVLVLVSGFFINTGYAKDSAFRHNTPVLKKDIFWICCGISLALIMAKFIRFDQNSQKYYEDIKKYKKQNYMLGYDDSIKYDKDIKLEELFYKKSTYKV